MSRRAESELQPTRYRGRQRQQVAPEREAVVRGDRQRSAGNRMGIGRRESWRHPSAAGAEARGPGSGVRFMDLKQGAGNTRAPSSAGYGIPRLDFPCILLVHCGFHCARVVPVTTVRSVRIWTRTWSGVVGTPSSSKLLNRAQSWGSAPGAGGPAQGSTPRPSRSRRRPRRRPRRPRRRDGRRRRRRRPSS